MSRSNNELIQFSRFFLMISWRICILYKPKLFTYRFKKQFWLISLLRAQNLKKGQTFHILVKPCEKTLKVKKTDLKTISFGLCTLEKLFFFTHSTFLQEPTTDGASEHAWYHGSDLTCQICFKNFANDQWYFHHFSKIHGITKVKKKM